MVLDSRGSNKLFERKQNRSHNQHISAHTPGGRAHRTCETSQIIPPYYDNK